MGIKKSVCNRWIIFTTIFIVISVTVIIVRYRHIAVGVLPDESWIYPSPQIAKGSIVSSSGPCAEIGMKILKKYGNAIDSLIATMICDGAVIFHKMGLGGGFIATIYIKSEDKVHVLNSREVAPGAATKDMFHENGTLSKLGGLAIAVPGELKGYWAMYKKYGGSAPWGELFEDSIKLCEEGIPINKHLASLFAQLKKYLHKSPFLMDMLLNEKGELPKTGDRLPRKSLARTLKIIAKEGPKAFYNGSLTKGLVNEIRENGGIITEEDFLKYESRWEKPGTVSFSSGHTLYFARAPSAGFVLAYILKLLDGALPQEAWKPRKLADTVSMITEAFKFGYALRSHLGDSYFTNNTETEDKFYLAEHINNIRSKLNISATSNDYHYYGGEFEYEDYGTANIIVKAPNGDIVTATSSINLFFGSLVFSQSTGVLFNNHMDDFSSNNIVTFFGIPPSKNNFIEPGKRPMSSMCPVIVVDAFGDTLAIGAAGGSKITSSVALVIMRKIWQSLSLVDAIKSPRFHHQLLPMVWNYEKTMPKIIVEDMKTRGHKTGKLAIVSVSAVATNGFSLEVSSDARREGNTSILL